MPRPAGEVDSIVTTAHMFEVRLPPGDAGSQQVHELAGYRVEPFDAFACGVAAFILYTKAPPWKRASPVDDTFRYIQGKGPTWVPTLLQAWEKPAISTKGGDLLEGLMRADPTRR